MNMKSKNNKNEQGFTLLEYAAGAAVLISVVFVGLSAMGQNLDTFFDGVATWLTNQTP